MIFRSTTAPLAGRGMRAQILLAGIAAVAAMALAPSPAFAIDNNREDARAAVVTAVRGYYKGWLSKGRTIKTECSGNRNVFNCDWWIIRGKFGYKPAPASLSIAPLAFVAESKGIKPDSVALSGQAQATWACLASGRKGRCTKYGFKVSFS
ncbi:MAG: hypothetical protein WCO96_09330 [Actinomycetes bacterium]